MFRDVMNRKGSLLQSLEASVAAGVTVAEWPDF